MVSDRRHPALTRVGHASNAAGAEEFTNSKSEYAILAGGGVKGQLFVREKPDV